MKSEEDDLPSTLNPACLICGLRFGSKPLLDLHVQEDHRQRVFRAQNVDRVPGSTRRPVSGADSPPEPGDPAAMPSWTSGRATAGSGRRGCRAAIALRKMPRTLGYANDRIRSAAGTVTRLTRAPRTRPHAAVPRGGKLRKAQLQAAPERADHGDCLICRASFPL